MAALYETFSRLLPEMRDFWSRIASDERAHAEVIEALSGKLATARLEVDTSKVTVAGIHSAIAFVSGRNSRFSWEGVTRNTALAMAIDAERGMLEHEFFSVFISEDRALLKEFRDLAVHTREHLERLEAEKAKESDS